MGGSPSNLSVGKEKPITIVTYIPGQALPPPGAAVPQPRAPGEPVNPYDPDGDGGLRASTLPRFTAQNTALHGTKTTVVPRALEQTPHLGVVQFIPQVVTPAERAEMRRLKEDRLNCRWDRYRTWQGQGHLIGGVAFGAFMSILTPNKWHKLARYAPLLAFGTLGATLDRWDRVRYCTLQHPLPDWYIRNAIPTSQQSEAKAREQAELRQAIEEVNEADRIAEQRAQTKR